MESFDVWWVAGFGGFGGERPANPISVKPAAARVYCLGLGRALSNLASRHDLPHLPATTYRNCPFHGK